LALILDTGPLYASLDRTDRDHRRCRALIEGTDEALVIPSPVLPEVDYLVSEKMGPGLMLALLRDIEANSLRCAGAVAKRLHARPGSNGPVLRSGPRFCGRQSPDARGTTAGAQGGSLRVGWAVGALCDLASAGAKRAHLLASTSRPAMVATKVT
jgi:hypothetical protein